MPPLLPNPKRHFPFTSHLSLSEFLILDLLSLYFKSFFSSYELLSFLHHSLLLPLGERFTPNQGSPLASSPRKQSVHLQ